MWAIPKAPKKSWGKGLIHFDPFCLATSWQKQNHTGNGN
jgi:hypothetical protein